MTQHPQFKEVPEPAPPSWRHELADLLAARATIARLEAEEAVQQLQRKVVHAAIVGIMIGFGWGLLLAGGIPLLAKSLHIGWQLIALITAAIHLLIAGVFLCKLRKPTAPAFAITRSEFSKDREWFKNLTPPES